jgi:hypothetical protein
VLLVIWVSHGGLRKNVLKLFGSDATSSDLKDRVGHMSDLLYYYAFIATALTIVISFLKMLPGKLFETLQSYLPTHDSLLQLLLNEIHRLIIFGGIYVYLIYNDGSISSFIQWDSKTNRSYSFLSGSSSQSDFKSLDGRSHQLPLRR